jgi:hypothetical protein
MRESSFPQRAGAVSTAVTGYAVAQDGSFRPEAPRVSTLPAAGGLWATAADLVTFGLGWPSLLRRCATGWRRSPARAWFCRSRLALSGLPGDLRARPE